MNAEINRVVSGEWSIDRFLRATASQWEALARYLHRRWSCPEGVTAEDVAQELRVAAWVAILRWDPTRGVTATKFVLWQASTAAKKWIHKQRAALRRSDRSPSRHAVAVATMSPEAEAAVFDRLVADWSEVEAVPGIRFDEVVRDLGEADRQIVLDVVETGDVARASERLWARSDTCIEHRIGSQVAATARVRRLVSRVTKAAAA